MKFRVTLERTKHTVTPNITQLEDMKVDTDDWSFMSSLILDPLYVFLTIYDIRILLVRTVFANVSLIWTKTTSLYKQVGITILYVPTFHAFFGGAHERVFSKDPKEEEVVVKSRGLTLRSQSRRLRFV